MSIAVATPRHVFGLKADVTGNICYLDEQTIIYPAGSNCILYNIDQKSQRFIPGTDKSSGMTAMAVSPNRRYVAIAEKGEKATITIYDLHTLRKRKVLSSPEVQSTEFVSLAFSPDSKYLVSQGGKPDWTLLYWTWEKAKVMAVTKSTNQMSSAVYQVCCAATWYFNYMIFEMLNRFVVYLVMAKSHKLNSSYYMYIYFTVKMWQVKALWKQKCFWDKVVSFSGWEVCIMNNCARGLTCTTKQCILHGLFEIWCLHLFTNKNF